jgi:hypothetical protein
MVMLAGAITLWMMFSLWLTAPLVGMRPVTAHVALSLSAVELFALLAWSYGVEDCDQPTCAPLARAAGIAARTDVPALAAALLVVTVVQLHRR